MENCRIKSHLSLVAFACLSLAACDDDDDGGVGASCVSADQCFVGLTQEVEGEPRCLDEVQGGYCTHDCDDDDDCCAVLGECPSEHTQVCAPFESTRLRVCFLSCEGQADGDGFCNLYAHAGFHCRSTGGGSRNRKVCVP